MTISSGVGCVQPKRTSKTGKPFGVEGWDDLVSHDLKATLSCIIFSDMLFVFCNLVQSVNYLLVLRVVGAGLRLFGSIKGVSPVEKVA